MSRKLIVFLISLTLLILQFYSYCSSSHFCFVSAVNVTVWFNSTVYSTQSFPTPYNIVSNISEVQEFPTPFNIVSNISEVKEFPTPYNIVSEISSIEYVKFSFYIIYRIFKVILEHPTPLTLEQKSISEIQEIPDPYSVLYLITTETPISTTTTTVTVTVTRGGIIVTQTKTRTLTVPVIVKEKIVETAYIPVVSEIANIISKFYELITSNKFAKIITLVAISIIVVYMIVFTVRRYSY